MSNRNDRRATEREARKLAYQELRQKTSQTELAISEAQLAANRANAQFSCGPLTEEGKAKSSMNALKHGLTGKTVLLPSDDAGQYKDHLTAYAARHQPATEEETALVEAIANSNWRLDRVQQLESAIYVKGRLEFADKFQDQPQDERPALIQLEAYLKYEKSIKNLNTQEARLRRMLDKDLVELKRVQTLRKRIEQGAVHTQQPARSPASENGFEFSTISISHAPDSQMGSNFHRADEPTS